MLPALVFNGFCLMSPVFYLPSIISSSDLHLPTYIFRIPSSVFWCPSFTSRLSYPIPMPHLSSSIFHLPYPIFHLSSSGVYLSASIFRLRSSIFRLPASVFRLPSSAFCRPSSFVCCLRSLSVIHLSTPS